jgi:WD40 repeat protein
MTLPLVHELGVTCADFSADGARLATGSRDGAVNVWDVKSGKAMFPALKHDACVGFLRFVSNGSQLMTFSRDGTATIWDTETGRLIRQVLKLDWNKNTRVFSIMRVADLSPNERWFARSVRSPVSGKDGVGVWDLSNEPVEEPVILEHSGGVQSVRFSRDTRHIVVASFPNGAATVWETSTGLQVGGNLEHDHMVNYAEFGPDGRLVVTASADRAARIWDAKTGKPLSGPLKHTDDVITAKFSPDGLRVVTASWDMTARVWDVATGMPLMKPFRHDDFLHYAEFSSDGRQVATACLDGTVQLWEIPVVQSPRASMVGRVGGCRVYRSISRSSVPIEATIARIRFE